ncbi:CLUMA_CG017787, isoform A [Clunio marinus]|uniref:CLUMA_CG017787, isoform A n=1 Tax=Clunio marinus TaxID=568069 RepID=A0A1J1IX47_9DIPT|nr:CLUMA_CG017787, isoform A [Clunio marinus]
MKKYMNPRLWIGLRATKATLDSAKFILFYGKTLNEQRAFTLPKAVEILEQEEFDNAKPTVIYIHGFIETMANESIKVIVDAYQTRGDHNIIILDWGELADGNYLLDAVPNSVKLGNILADTILDLVNNGLDVNKLHLVGHSLGGQMAGYIARKIKDKSCNTIKLKRISALDPAFPPFYPGVFVKPLNKKDAELVDVIHTDAWLYGAPASTGTADFWPNSGKTLQPGCPKRNYKMLSENDLCSHRRSWYFWAESVARKQEKSFPSIKCKSWNNFKEGRHEGTTEIAYMGIDCPLNASGDYFLQTNGETPFSKGMTGTVYEAKKSKT